MMTFNSLLILNVAVDPVKVPAEPAARVEVQKRFPPRLVVDDLHVSVLMDGNKLPIIVVQDDNI